MTRTVLILAGVLFIGGCAAAPRPQQANLDSQDPAPRDYGPAAASALAFDSPIMASYELPGLDRASREPSAFLGYQGTITEFFSIGMEDHQTDGGRYYDGYDRWSYSEKVGVRYR